MFVYSARLRRRIVTLPGSGRPARGECPRVASSQATTVSYSSSLGRLLPSGGILRARSIWSTLPHVARPSETAAAVRYLSNWTPRSASAPRWQSKQYRLTNGSTAAS